MNQTTNTPGPLKVSLAYGDGSAIWISPETGPAMILQGAQCLRADTVKPEPMHAEQLSTNATRLVACWNACDGIDTDLLEGFSPRFLATLPDRHLEQRSELLNALKACKKAMAAAIEALAINEEAAALCEQAEGIADAAINKATGAPA